MISATYAGENEEKINSAQEIKSIPLSFKGYELYSWKENDLWQFTLIYGTNRNKFSDEIMSKENVTSDHIKITVTGVDALKDLLAKLEKGEYVTWVVGQIKADGKEIYTKFDLPPRAVVEEIQDYSSNQGLNFLK